jgi:hypothetical protein
MLATVITGAACPAGIGVAVAIGVGVGVLKGVGLAVGNGVGTTNRVGVAIGVGVGIANIVGVRVGNGVLDGVGKGVLEGVEKGVLVNVGNTVFSGGSLVTTLGTVSLGAWVGSLVDVEPQPTAAARPAVSKPILKTLPGLIGPVCPFTSLLIR